MKHLYLLCSVENVGVLTVGYLWSVEGQFGSRMMVREWA